MARLSLLTLALSLLLPLALSSDPTLLSPAPAPQPHSDLLSPASSPSDPASPTGSPFASAVSPPVPPPENLAPVPSPPTLHPPSLGSTPAPAPEPSHAADEKGSISPDEEAGDGGSSGRMSSGKKAGITIAVIAMVALAVVGGNVYRKRQENIRRSQYSYAARREIL